jgi:hypothetical protein
MSGCCRVEQVWLVPDYRCYFLDPYDHIFDVESVDQPTDALASEEGARRLRTMLCHAVEVFDKGRLICRIGKPPAKREG